MKRWLPFIIVGVVAILAVGSGAMLYRSKSHATVSAKPGASGPRKTDNALHIRGEREAPVTLEEFGDFQCPPCAHISNAIDEMERDYHPQVRVVFRNFPLAVHAHAAEAAYAAEAAGLQGRFWEMHDMLYREQAKWSTATDAPAMFKSYAGMLGLDIDRFQNDVKSPAVKASVESDLGEGAARGVKSTPTIFINGALLEPASFNPKGMHAALEAAIKQTSSSKPK
jgi:protein-disulfide isomerase